MSDCRRFPNLPFGITSPATPDMASQNRRMKLRRYIQLSTTRRNFLRRFAKPCLALQTSWARVLQIVNCCTTGWSPSFTSKPRSFLRIMLCIQLTYHKIRNFTKFITEQAHPPSPANMKIFESARSNLYSPPPRGSEFGRGLFSEPVRPHFFMFLGPLR